jgi:hypothetical protein
MVPGFSLSHILTHFGRHRAFGLAAPTGIQIEAPRHSPAQITTACAMEFGHLNVFALAHAADRNRRLRETIDAFGHISGGWRRAAQLLERLTGQVFPAMSRDQGSPSTTIQSTRRLWRRGHIDRHSAKQGPGVAPPEQKRTATSSQALTLGSRTERSIWPSPSDRRHLGLTRHEPAEK